MRVALVSVGTATTTCFPRWRCAGASPASLTLRLPSTMRRSSVRVPKLCRTSWTRLRPASRTTTSPCASRDLAHTTATRRTLTRKPMHEHVWLWQLALLVQAGCALLPLDVDAPAPVWPGPTVGVGCDESGTWPTSLSPIVACRARHASLTLLNTADERQVLAAASTLRGVASRREHPAACVR